jgi:hypothetical protein
VGASDLERLREVALALPEVSERLSHGAMCFFVRGKKPLCYFHDHHNDDRVSLWCPAPPGVQEQLVTAEPARFFKPTPSANGTFSDWLGCSSIRQAMPGSTGTRSLRSSKTPSAWWRPHRPWLCSTADSPERVGGRLVAELPASQGVRFPLLCKKGTAVTEGGP